MQYPNSPNRQKQSSYAKPISHPSPVKDGLSYKGALEKRSPPKKLSSDDTSSPLKSKVKANGQTPSRVSWQDNNNISSNEGNDGSEMINPPPLLQQPYQHDTLFNPSAMPEKVYGFSLEDYEASSSSDEDDGASLNPEIESIVGQALKISESDDKQQKPPSSSSLPVPCSSSLPVPSSVTARSQLINRLATKMQTLPCMPEHVQNAVSKTRHVSTDPYYKNRIQKGDTMYEQYYELKKLNVTTEVGTDVVYKLLQLSHDSHGELSKIAWNPKAEYIFKSRKWRAEFVLKYFSKIVPRHFVIRCHRNELLTYTPESDGDKKKSRGGSIKLHPFVVAFNGYCMGQKDGCPTVFVAGFSSDQLKRLSLGYNGTIDCTMIISGACCHPFGATYGMCRGPDRKKEVKIKVEGDKRSPSSRANDNVSDMPDEDYIVGNFEGGAFTRQKQYAIQKEAKEEVAVKYGLTGCSLANILHSSEKIKAQDITQRMKLKDNSVDVLGILQHSSIHNGLTMHLYTKPQIILMCSLLKSHQLILYYDPTGQMLSLKNCGFSKHILHSKLSFCPEEMYVDKKKRTVSANCFMASVLAEHVSHHQKSDAHAAFFKQLREECFRMSGVDIPPRLVNTDCAGGLQNGIIAGYHSDGQVTNRIMWNNIVTIVFLWYEHLLLTNNSSSLSPAQDRPAFQAFLFLDKLLPVFINACVAHVYRAIVAWIQSKDRPISVKLLDTQIVSMFKHTGVEMTRSRPLSEVMTFLASIVVILTRQTIPIPSFNMDSPTREHRDHQAMKDIGQHMKVLKDSLALSLLIGSTTDMESKLEKQMEVNEKPSKQCFNGLELVEPIIRALEDKMFFSYTYLHSKNEIDNTAILHTHIIYDTEEDDEGILNPIFAGYFENSVTLPCSGTMQNPMYCFVAGEYLKTTWLKEPAIWARAPIDLLEIVTLLKIWGNDQHAEGIIKHIKENPDLDAHCQQVATYLWWNWINIHKCLKTLSSDYKKLALVLSKRMAKKAAKKLRNDATADAIENERMNDTDEAWGVSEEYRGLKGEIKLRSDIIEVFDRLLQRNQSNSKRHEVLSNFHDGNGEGTLAGFGYGIFNKWMKNKQPVGWKLKPAIKTAMMAFITAYEEHAVLADQDLPHAISHESETGDNSDVQTTSLLNSENSSDSEVELLYNKMEIQPPKSNNILAPPTNVLLHQMPANQEHDTWKMSNIEAELLLSQLSSEDENLFITLISDKRPGGFVIAKCGSNSVQLENLQRLKLDGLAHELWQSDEVITFYTHDCLRKVNAEYCARTGEKRSSFFSSHFYKWLMQEKTRDMTRNGKYSYEEVKNWGKRAAKRAQVNSIFETKCLFFPINRGDNHWTCVVAYMDKKIVRYYNSDNRLTHDSVIRNILRYLRDESIAIGKATFNIDEWKLVGCTSDTPVQFNWYDCGIFVCMFCNFLSRGLEPVFRQEHMPQCRKRILLSIYKQTDE